MSRPISLDTLPRRAVRRHVISGSMFHRETATLDWRLHELDAVVDDFVLVESVLTHSGKPSVVVRPDLDPRFSWMAGRLHVTVIEDPPRDPDPWVRETTQRAAIWSDGAARLDPPDDALVIISDVDEVPFPEVVEQLAFAEFDEPLYLRPHWFNFNWRTYLGAWDHPSIRCYTAGSLRRLFAAGRGVAVGRCNVPGHEALGLNGWHASWFGSDEFILEKLSAYAHAADDRDRAAMAEGEEGVKRRRASGGDMFGIRQTIDALPRLPAHAARLPGAMPD